MQHLTRLSAAQDAAWYQIGGDHAGRVDRYLVSTPASRAVSNKPELVGCDYTERMSVAMAAALESAPFRQLVESQPEHQLCVLHFLRGGLNFDLRGALRRAYGLNRHCAAFMSSQRSRRADGRWQVREDMYRKLEIPADATILMGDVVATGVTMENGLDVLLDHLCDIGSSARRLVCFTIGCHKIEKTLEHFDARARSLFPNYQGAVAVYFEGKFKLVDSRTELRIGIPGTDLVRTSEALLAPEFEASQWERMAHPLERCAIYDAGSRAFDVPRYLDDVTEYWRKVAALAEGGLTLREAVEERFPLSDYATLDTLMERGAAQWRGVPAGEIKAIHASEQVAWRRQMEAAGDGADALAALAARRIEEVVLP